MSEKTPLRLSMPYLLPCIALAFVLSFQTGTARAGADGKRLESLERALDKGRKKGLELDRKAASLAREVAGIRAKQVRVARAIQNFEAEITLLEDRLAELARAEASQTERLARRKGQFAKVLTALRRIAGNPPEAFIAQPLSPGDTVRSAILLRATVPAIERQAFQLQNNLRGLMEARRETAQRKTELARVSKSMNEQRARLDLLFNEKKRYKAQTEGQRRAARLRTRALVKEARTLRDLLRRLKAEQRKKDRLKKKKERQQFLQRRKKGVNLAIRPGKKRPPDRLRQTVALTAFSRSRGKLPFPAIGRLVGRYGEKTDGGLTRKGILIKTRPKAQVIAPYGGQVVFAGKFRSYGQLLIIEHGEGYHSLLAGLDRIDSVIGQSVLAGEPVGVMERSDKRAPVLYLELRRNGQPINPLPWLTAGKSKVNG